MVRKNPYYIGDDLRIDLRDKRGRFSSASKAKYFSIYINSQLVYSGEFPRVTASVDRKDFIVAEALNEVFSRNQSLVPVEDYIEYDEEDFEEEVESDLSLDDQNQLAEDMFKDLLELIAGEDPLLFEKLTGLAPPLKGEIEEEYKEIQSLTYGGADLQKFKFWLDNPITLSSKDPEIFVDIVQRIFLPAMKKAYDERIEGLDYFLISLIYSQKIKTGKNQVEDVVRGMSIARFEAKNWKEFLFFVDEIYELVRESYLKYLERSFDNRLTVLGFTLENMYEAEFE